MTIKAKCSCGTTYNFNTREEYQEWKEHFARIFKEDLEIVT